MKVLFACTLLGMAASVGAAAAQSPSSFQPLAVDGENAASARGIWRSRGYGWILEIQPRQLAVYQISQAGCSKDPRTTNFAAQFGYRSTASSQQVLMITSYPGENRYVLDRLPRLPAECSQARWTAPQLFDHFVASYREHYAFFREHNLDFEGRVRLQRPQITENTSPRELFTAFSQLLDGLGDAHVSLNAKVDGAALTFRTGRGPTMQLLHDRALQAGQEPAEARSRWLAAYHRGIRDSILGGRFQQGANDKLVWGRIGSDIGYINIAAVEDFAAGSLGDNIRTVNALLDRILAELDGVRAIVVDITHNTGGYDRLAREISGHFATERMLAYTKRPFGVEPAIVDELYVVPSNGRRFTGPVYLLTSDITVSGGEILTMTMRVLPNVTQVGTATRGALSDRLTKVLPDGSDFSISNEIYLDPSGQLFEAVGVPPHHRLEVFPPADLEHGHARAVLALAEQIRAGTIRRK
ncbi:MAG TPA: S41 family peptidase [Steroidobacteraceae bacterium]|nr:S41 family peptidase [Steroidobacteraceae bacterium]